MLFVCLGRFRRAKASASAMMYIPMDIGEATGDLRPNEKGRARCGTADFVIQMFVSAIDDTSIEIGSVPVGDGRGRKLATARC